MNRASLHSAGTACRAPARREARWLVLAALGALVGASFIAGFRAEDWLNLEVGWRALLAAPGEVWRSPNALGIYRPIADIYHGVMLKAFGLDPTPHLLALVVLLAAQTLLWARVAALRRGTASIAWPVAASVLAQTHAYAGSALWVSTSARSLATTFLLTAVWLHHRAVAAPLPSAARRVIRLVPIALAAGLAPLAKEDAVLLAPLVVALEAVRWRSLHPAERREALASLGVIAAACVVYFAVRVPTPPMPEQSTYRLRVDVSSLIQLGRFLMLLGVPVLATVALAGARAWRAGKTDAPSGVTPRDPMFGPGAGSAPREALAGLAWGAVAMAPYLLLGGFSYGYLYLPLWGLALALASSLEYVAMRSSISRNGRGRSQGLWLAVLWVVTAAGSAAYMVASGVPRYRALASDAYAVLDRTLPEPAPGATLLFLDPAEPETPPGRSLFNMVFDNVPVSMARLHFGRLDLEGRMLEGTAAREAAAAPPVADAVYLARAGRLVLLRGEGHEPR